MNYKKNRTYDLIDPHSIFTIKGVILFCLFRDDRTFSEIVRATNLPRKTVAKYIGEFQLSNIVQGRKDPHHKQKIVYELTPSAKKWTRKYFSKTISEILEIPQEKGAMLKNTKTQFEYSMNLDTKFKIVVFDMDGVLFRKPWENPQDDRVAVSSWDALFRELGMYDEHERLKAVFANSAKIDYKAWSEAACTVLKAKGLTRLFFDRFTKTRTTINGAGELMQILKENNIRSAIISGSFDNIAQYAKEKLGIDYVAASCKLKFDRKGLLSDWIVSRTDYEDKAKHFQYILKSHGIDPKDAVYVGDDVNDLHVFEAAGMSIAFNASKDIVKKSADYVVDSDTLLDIVPCIQKGAMKMKNRH